MVRLFCLQSDGLKQLHGVRLFWICSGHDLETARIHAACTSAAGVAHHGRQFVEQSAKAMRRRAVLKVVSRGFALRGL